MFLMRITLEVPKKCCSQSISAQRKNVVKPKDWVSFQCGILSTHFFAVHRCAPYQEACIACKCKCKWQKQTVLPFSSPRVKKMTVAEKTGFLLIFQCLNLICHPILSKIISLNGSHFYGQFIAVRSICFGIISTDTFSIDINPEGK